MKMLVKMEATNLSKIKSQPQTQAAFSILDILYRGQHLPWNTG